MESVPVEIPPGRCGSCRHAERVRGRGGAVYVLCGRSRTDPGFPKYPKLPVLSCPGYEAGRPPPELPLGDPRSGKSR